MKILLVGDSHTQMTFPILKPKLENAGFEVVGMVSNAGWGVKSYLKSFSQIESGLASNPDVVFISLGGNNHDLSSNYWQTVQSFLSKLGYPGRRVVWFGPLSSDTEKASSTAARHEWTADYLRQNLPSDIPFLDSRPHTLTGHRGDGVHFPRSGYQTLMDTMEKAILKSVTKRSLVPKKATSFLWVGGAMLLIGAAIYYRSKK